MKIYLIFILFFSFLFAQEQKRKEFKIIFTPINKNLKRLNIDKGLGVNYQILIEKKEVKDKHVLSANKKYSILIKLQKFRDFKTAFFLDRKNEQVLYIPLKSLFPFEMTINEKKFFLEKEFAVVDNITYKLEVKLNGKLGTHKLIYIAKNKYKFYHHNSAPVVEIKVGFLKSVQLPLRNYNFSRAMYIDGKALKDHCKYLKEQGEISKARKRINQLLRRFHTRNLFFEIPLKIRKEIAEMIK